MFAALGAAVVVALLVVGIVLATGDDDGDGKDDDADGSPTNASQADFCQVSQNEDSLDIEGTDQEVAKAANDFAADLREVGTPSDISPEAREGFELYVDELADVEADDIDEFKEGLQGVFDADEIDKVEAFITYVTEMCLEAEAPETE